MRKRTLAVMAICLFCALFCFRRETVNFIRGWMRDLERIEAFNTLLGGLNPNSMGEVNPRLSSNQYMSPFLLERMRWIEKRKKDGRLKFFLIRDMENNMMCCFIAKDGVMNIGINCVYLLSLCKDYGELSERGKRGVRTSIALKLAHETLHLEERSGNYARGKPFDSVVDEEMYIRTVIAIEGVLPLYKKEEIIESYEFRTLEVLSRCCPDFSCKEFRDMITDLYRKK